MAAEARPWRRLQPRYGLAGLAIATLALLLLELLLGRRLAEQRQRTLAGELAEAGLAVLLLERGKPLPLADQNVANIDLFRRRRYHPGEEWIGTDGDPFAPQMVMAPGGNTKIWGAVLERMREREFGQLPMQEGPGPDWELRYGDLAPWYDSAEALYRVHGEGGVDATEPPRSCGYPLPPRPLEAFQESLRDDLGRQGLRPYRLPLSVSEIGRAHV